MQRQAPRLYGKLQDHNMAKELQKAKKELIFSIKKYSEAYKKLKNIDNPTFDEKFEETDAWGNLLHKILYYDEIKKAMRYENDTELAVNMFAWKMGIKND